MPQAIPMIIGTLGGPLGIVPGAVLGIDTGFIGKALGLGSSGAKADAAERGIKSAKPARVHVLGERRVYPTSSLFTTSGGSLDVAGFDR